MQPTQYFGLEKPDRGSYFGSWHTPVNANMDLIDSTLHSIRTNNKDKAQGDIAEAGVTWWDTAAKLFYIHNGTSLVGLVTKNEFVLELLQQQELIAGPTAPATSLHWHAGDVSKFYIVKDPTLASGVDLANKNNFAVNWKLFNDTIGGINAINTSTISDVAALKVKVNGISANGIDITIGNVTASGSITANGVTSNAGTTGGNIKIGGGTSATENEIVVSKNLPVNIKTNAASANGFELRVQGQKVWTAGNMGIGSGLVADKVDNCNVDDTKTTTTNLWTANKVMAAINSAVSGVDIPDTSGLATKQDLQNHKASSDHDTHNDARYAKKTDIFNVMVGGTILFDTDMVPDWATKFDGTWTGRAGTEFDGWKVCTGNNGTKNLIDKFVLGGGPGATFPVTGGESEHILKPVESPEHRHITGQFNADDNNDWQTVTAGTPSAVTSVANFADKFSTIDGDGTGDHGLFDLNTGTSSDKTVTWTSRKMFDTKDPQPHNNMPPYVAMVYMTRYK